ncbi:MAG: DUF167 domain-containing protein [Chitinivibrionales bacterium]|nr:DUF167 domain-containing protein [Chitinivibrionales bacterium]MBD3395348.1 DUF167 domain-containing protein [Chitinivibrionales bacterium]
MRQSCKINVRLRPQAKRNAVSIDPDGNAAVTVTSPPVDGKANAHAIKLLAKTLGIPKSSCTITKGHTSRNKVIAIQGIDEATAARAIREKAS